ncbi:MAG: hypothetical protein ABGZ17_24875 [Planctomycetaceae bacterium]
MPDWTYQTVFRSALLGLGPQKGRGLALRCMGFLARLPAGKHVIQFMGHMQPDDRLRVERNGLEFPTSVGLGCAVDPRLLATPALSEFGFGFLEIGPIVLKRVVDVGSIHVDVDAESIRCESPQAALTAAEAQRCLLRDGPFHLPLFARIEPTSATEARQVVDVLGACVDGFFVSVDCLENLLELQDDGCELPRRVFVSIDANAWGRQEHRKRCAQAMADGTLSGVVVGGRLDESGDQQFGKTGYEAALETVRLVRAELGPDPVVVGAVGVHSPADALDYFEAGADLIQVDSGLVFTGPGLPKRVNSALLYRRLAAVVPDRARAKWFGQQSWFWAILMGLSMLIGGLTAMVVASTRVVLPYDESMAGLTRGQLIEANTQLLPFMRHDRVTLSGTMLAVGILYITMAWWGIRRGVDWAYVSLIVSAVAGFGSFFSFLGFGYFDPFHAFVTAIMFQFLLLMIYAGVPPLEHMEPPDLWNDRSWKANQWGQLLFVIHGAVLIVAGLVITSIGMTSVFVPEDLEFLHTSAEDLRGIHPQLVPLVAHDRSTFGGMLIACGVATLLPALWGFRRGQAWLWWALMLAGNTAYVATIIVHWTVGYDSLKHLLPAYGGLLGLWAGGIASYWFLVGDARKLEAEWSSRLEKT